MSIFNINPLPQQSYAIRAYHPSNGKQYDPENKPKSKHANIDPNRFQTNPMVLSRYRIANKIKKTLFIPDAKYSASIKVVIYTPPLSEVCGGIMVLHNLAKSIEQMFGENIKAYLFYYDCKVYNNNFCNNFFNPFLIDDKTIVVYPETISGNPLNAKHVVRWVLLDLGYEMSKNWYKSAWHKKDIVYHWEPSNLEYSKQLVNIWINPVVQQNKSIQNRHKKCYAFKKINFLPKAFHSKIHTYHNKNDINIDEIEDIKDTVKVFNECDTFYCYDPNTFFSIMAPLCGCKTVLHPVEGIDKKTYLNSRITGHPSGFCYDAGIAYGNEKSELERASITLPQAQQQFDKLTKLYHSTVVDFVDDMVSMINGKTLDNTVENIYYRNEQKNKS